MLGSWRVLIKNSTPPELLPRSPPPVFLAIYIEVFGVMADSLDGRRRPIAREAYPGKGVRQGGTQNTRQIKLSQPITAEYAQVPLRRGKGHQRLE